MTEFTKLKGDNSVLSSYSSEELKNYVIIWNDSNKHYFVFKTFTEFEQWYMSKEKKTYHEVIFSHCQRLKFDIDIKDTSVNIYKIMTTILDAIVNAINDNYKDYKVGLSDFIVTDSSSQEKYSYHIILYRCAVKNNKEADYITNIVINSLPTEYKKYIDNCVNKDIQCFRLLWSHKSTSSRVKHITNTFGTNVNVTLQDTMIRPFAGIRVLLPLQNNDYLDNSEEITNDVVKRILSLAKKYNILNGHEYRNIQGNSINFNRLIATHCFLCDRIHDHDNSLVLYIIGESIYEYCRRGKTSRYICNISQNEIDINNIINQHKDTILFNDLPNTQKNVYDSTTMYEYELEPTLVVKAQMKVGKTKQLKQHIDTHFNNNCIIRFVTFRQTFSSYINSLFNDFKSYSDIKGTITDEYKKVIIQVESLHRLQIGNIDLLILDEVESVLSQLSSGLHKHFVASIATFVWLLTNAKYVICIDANVSNRTYNILTRFRKQSIFFHHNTYNKASDDKYYITSNKTIWLNKLHDYLKLGKKIVIPTNSLSMAKTCAESIIKTMPHLNVKLFSSELKTSDKKMYFNNVEKHWSLLDVLIYTPTCSAGISYELDTFDVIFGCFSNLSCDVETCRQMINRVRNIKSKEYYILFQISETGNLPTTTDEMHKFIYNKRLNLINNCKDMDNVIWSYTENGDIKFYETHYYYIWLENVIIHNLSKINFISRFCQQVHDAGGTISELKMLDCNKDITMSFNVLKKSIKDEENKRIAESYDLEENDIIAIREKRSNQEDLSDDEKYAYEKHQLTLHYGQFNSNLIDYYRQPHIKKIYTNLCKIARESTIKESIANIIAKEINMYNIVITNNSSNKMLLEFNDLHNDNKRYSSQCHIIISQIITLIGTEAIEKDQFDELFNNKLIPLITKEELSIELNIKLVDDKKQMLKKILYNMYGLKVYRTRETMRLQISNDLKKVIVFSKEIIPDKITIITKNDFFLSLK